MWCSYARKPGVHEQRQRAARESQASGVRRSEEGAIRGQPQRLDARRRWRSPVLLAPHRREEIGAPRAHFTVDLGGEPSQPGRKSGAVSVAESDPSGMTLPAGSWQASGKVA